MKHALASLVLALVLIQPLPAKAAVAQPYSPEESRNLATVQASAFFDSLAFNDLWQRVTPAP